jgi:hypothetical protein
MARQASKLIAAVLLAFAGIAAAETPPDRLKTPQTDFRTLSPPEKRVLAPIQDEWSRLPGYQQQRLISSARRYPDMQPIQKERFDARIRGWAAMSPEQRREARDTFQGLRKLPPAQQHELRERWLQRHRSEDGIEAAARSQAPQVQSMPQEARQPIPREMREAAPLRAPEPPARSEAPSEPVQRRQSRRPPPDSSR